MTKEVIYIVDRSSGEVIKKLDDNEDVIVVERDLDEGLGRRGNVRDFKVDNRMDIGQLAGNQDEKYVKANARDNDLINIKYSRFLKINQAAIFDLLKLNLTSTQMEIYWVILAFSGYLNKLHHQGKRTALQPKLVASLLNISERKAKEGLNVLCKAGVIICKEDGYFLNFRYAMRGNSVEFSTFERFNAINFGIQEGENDNEETIHEL